MLAAVSAVVLLSIPPTGARVAAMAALPLAAAQQSAEQSAVGTLDQVDVGASQIVVATTSGKLAFRVQTGATIRQGSTKLSPAALASHKGERVKVRYRESGGVRRADWIVVAAARPQRRP